MKIEPGINEPCLDVIRRLVQKMQPQGELPILALSMDEMSIRRHIDFDIQKRKLVGMCEGHPIIEDATATAREALVFMVNGMNCDLQIPIALFS